MEDPYPHENIDRLGVSSYWEEYCESMQSQLFHSFAFKLKGLTARTVFSNTRDSTCPERAGQQAWKEYKCYLWTAPSDICQGIYRFPLSFLAAAARCARRLGALLVVGVVRCLLQLEYQSSATGEVLRFSFSVLYKAKYPKYYAKLKWVLYIFVFGQYWKFRQFC